MIERLIRALKDPVRIISYLKCKGFFNFLSDKAYIKLEYFIVFRKKLNLDNPQTFNEKLQWLKLYDRNPLYTTLVDKYEVKKYIANEIGEEYVIPTLGIWNSYQEIDFENLPNQFVLKTTHDSGTYIICKDKSNFDYIESESLLKRRLKRWYYKEHREWPYKDVKRQIIGEQLLNTKDNNLPVDYKFFCYNGKADCVMLCLGRGTKNKKFYFFDKGWNLLRYNVAGKAAQTDFTLPKPEKMDEMFELAERLSFGIPFVRIDLYYENDKIYFGEFTFYPDSGYDKNLLIETDKLFGEKINLGGIKR